MKRKFGAAWRVACVALAATLAGCGGELVSTFTPQRIVALGDEASVIVDVNHDANGRKYSVNWAVTAGDSTISCMLYPVWTQMVANQYGLVFPECNPTPAVAPASRIRAAFGARVADIAAQIDAQQAESPLGAGDMVMIMVGVNDVLAQYQQYPLVGEPELTRNLQLAGVALAAQVNRVSDTGAKVLVATAYDLAVTPFGQAEKARYTDTDRAALLSRLTTAFNSALRGGDSQSGQPGIYNDGRRIGLILADDYFRLAAVNAGSYGFNNTVDPVCTTVSLLDCTTATLVPGGNGLAYMWADTMHLSAGGQNSLGNLALTRATNNPF